MRREERGRADDGRDAVAPDADRLDEVEEGHGRERVRPGAGHAGRHEVVGEGGRAQEGEVRDQVLDGLLVGVPLDGVARESASTVSETIDAALAEPFLPAAPGQRACQWCDYRPVCGPYEELRAGRKVKGPLAPLQRLRELP